jgi:hypothetical protein
MRLVSINIVPFICASLVPGLALAQGSDAASSLSDEGYLLIVGAGGAAELELAGSGHLGLSAFLEIEAIDKWLEIEIGGQVLAIEGGREASVDLLFKKPFTLTERLEVMIGLGPALIRTQRRSDPDHTSWGIEAALDFMYWPRRHFGLWLEPAYEIVLSGGVAHALSCTGGPMLGF